MPSGISNKQMKWKEKNRKNRKVIHITKHILWSTQFLYQFLKTIFFYFPFFFQTFEIKIENIKKGWWHISKAFINFSIYLSFVIEKKSAQGKYKQQQQQQQEKEIFYITHIYSITFYQINTHATCNIL